MSNRWPYQTVGSPEKPALVFLHGFLGSGDEWLSIAEQLTADFYCLLPDMPGHGRYANDQMVSQSLTFDLLTHQLMHLLDVLHLQQVHLVGYSMGGRVGLYTAVSYPHRIASLVLEGASPGIANSLARQERARLDDDRANTLLKEGMSAFIEQWYDMPLFHTLKKYPDLLAETKQKRKQNNAQWMAKVIRDLSPGQQPALWDQLGSLSMPVLLVAGELDTHYANLITQMQRQIPYATAELVPNTGHNVHLENPEAFIKLFKSWQFMGLNN